MFDFLTASQNLPFSVAICLMLTITFMEGVTTLLGAGISDLLESLTPDFDLDADLNFEVEVDNPDFDTQGGMTKILGWIRVGEVPVLMLLIVFLMIFGLIGLGVQSLVLEVFGHMLPAFAAGIMVFFVTLPFVRMFGGLLAKVIPKDETDAVSEDSFIGRTATIILGKASKQSPTRAKLKDQYGTTHYIMVEPDVDTEIFEQGASVILVSRIGAVFRVIRNTSPVLHD